MSKLTLLQVVPSSEDAYSLVPFKMEEEELCAEFDDGITHCYTNHFDRMDEVKQGSLIFKLDCWKEASTWAFPLEVPNLTAFATPIMHAGQVALFVHSIVQGDADEVSPRMSWPPEMAMMDMAQHRGMQVYTCEEAHRVFRAKVTTLLAFHESIAN